MRPVGYYVHHQGMGHFDRACMIATRLARRCTLIGTIGGRHLECLDALDLPDDSAAGDAASTQDVPETLHFAPVNSALIRQRMAKIATWVAANDPALVVVDVSVEVAIFCRLLSIPTVYVRLAGDRSDPAHLNAFRAAERIIAPFPKSFEHPSTPGWVRAKTTYAGFIHARLAGDALPEPIPETIAVVIGEGGTHLSVEALFTAARATPGYRWLVYGSVPNSRELPPNLTMYGFVSDIDDRVASADILVGACGDGVLSLAVRHGKRFLCIPEERPYAEQFAKAQALAACGAAIVLPTWFGVEDWPHVIESVSSLDRGPITALRSDCSLDDVVRTIEGVASKFDPQAPIARQHTSVAATSSDVGTRTIR